MKFSLKHCKRLYLSLLLAGFSAYAMAQSPELLYQNGTVYETTDVINRALFDYNSESYFIVENYSNGSAMYKTDGTASGTEKLLSLSENENSQINFYGYYTTSNRAYFMIEDNFGHSRFYETDGTAPGTQVLFEDLTYYASQGTVLNDTVFFPVGNSIYKIHGTDTVHVYTDTGSSAAITSIAGVGSTIFFSSNMGGLGYELAALDLGSRTAGHIAEFNSGTASSSPSGFTGFNGSVYFKALDGLNTTLYKVTSDSNSIVKLFSSSGGDSGPINPSQYGIWKGTSKMYFLAEGYVSSQGTGEELWVTDGTASGTQMVKDFYPFNSDGSNVGIIGIAGDNLFFNARNDLNAPWEKNFYKTDGTSSGSTIISTPAAVSGAAVGSDFFFNFQGRMFKNDTTTEMDFVEYTTSIIGSAVTSKILINGRNCGNGQNCFEFDATDAGYYLANPSGPSAEYLGINTFSISSSTDIQATSEELYFTEYHSDGTVSTTGAVTDGNGGYITVGKPTELNGKTYSVLWDAVIELDDDGNYLGEVWKNNDVSSLNIMGAVGSKYLILNGYDVNSSSEVGFAIDMTSGDTSSVSQIIHIGAIYNLIESGTDMYYINGNAGTALWKWEIGTANTTLIHDEGFYTVSKHNNDIYLYGGDYLGKVNGTSVDSVMLSSLGIVAIEEMIATTFGLVFYYQSTVDGFEVGVTDGTLAGTKLLTGDSVNYVTHTPEMIELNGEVLFTRMDSTGDMELWETDGTVANTVLLKEINTQGSAHPIGFTKVGSNVYFSAHTQDKGRELWVTNGTSTGTKIVADLNPGPGYGLQGHYSLVNFRDELYFAGNTDQVVGIYKLGDVGTGIEETEAPDVLLFPNPTEGKAMLAIGEGLLQPGKQASVTVFNQLGSLVQQVKVTQSTVVLDLTKLESGMYYIKLSTGDRQITKTLMIQN